MTTISVHRSCSADLNFLSAIILFFLLSAATVFTSIVASKSPSKGPYVKQVLNCQLYNNQGANSEKECLSRWCANSAHWPLAQCQQVNLSRKAYDPEYNRRYLDDNFPFDDRSSALAWTSLALIACAVCVLGVTQIIDLVDPKKKRQHLQVSKRYRILTVSLASMTWAILITVSGLVLAAAVLAGNPWGLYNTTSAMWESAAVLLSLAALSGSFFQIMVMRNYHYIKQGNSSTSISPIHLSTATMPSSHEAADMENGHKPQHSFKEANGTPARKSPGEKNLHPSHILSSEVFQTAVPPPAPKLSHLGNQSPMKNLAFHEHTLDEMIVATDNFAETNMLGQGGFGCVYRGVLENGRVVAIKRIHGHKALHGTALFRAEVEIICRVHHRNLTRLLGYCIKEDEQLLVLEFMSNGSLDDFLRDESRRSTLDWKKRLTIATDAARGLAYLHNDCTPKVVHRDIKASNILLADDFSGKVADFGLARLMGDSLDHVTTRVMGTIGYLAPDYAFSGQLTQKSDVYSFGVVLLELLTGKRPIEDGQSLVEWAWKKGAQGDDPQAFVDKCMKANYSPPGVRCMWKVALECVHHVANDRPPMEKVLKTLSEHLDSPEGAEPRLEGTEVSGKLATTATDDAQKGLAQDDDSKKGEQERMERTKMQLNDTVGGQRRAAYVSSGSVTSFPSSESQSQTVSVMFRGLVDTAKAEESAAGSTKSLSGNCESDCLTHEEQPVMSTRSESRRSSEERKVAAMVEKFEQQVAKLEKQKRKALEEEWEQRDLLKLNADDTETESKIQWWSQRMERLRLQAEQVNRTSQSDAD